MKTSLLLLVLTTGAMATGAVQATECSPVPSMPTEGRPLGAPGASADQGDSFSALDLLLSADSNAGDSADDVSDAPSEHVGQPGPAMHENGSSMPVSPSQRRTSPSTPAASASSAADRNADASESSYSGGQSSLGWQSLLPGSIQ